MLRTKQQIYPERYGVWDDTITLYHIDEAPNVFYDLVIIGTPPDSHISLAHQEIDKVQTMQ